MTTKRVRQGEAVKYSGVKLKWLFDIAFAALAILIIYVILPAVMSTNLSFIITFAPVTMIPAIVFAWIELAHSLFKLWVKAFMSGD